MTQGETEYCRLVLIAPEGVAGAALAERIAAALSGGDVASVIVPRYGMDEVAYQKNLEACVPAAQNGGAAAIVVDDTRAFGRSGADGLHVDEGPDALGDAVERFQANAIVGAGGAETRHRALELGELRPDYMFFGRFGMDIRPQAHRKNLQLAEWWASMVEIPCIVLAGASVESVADAARTGAEFVALSRAVLGDDADPAEAVRETNAILRDFPLEETA